MKLCKIGIHDWESVDVKKAIEHHIHNILVERGFTYKGCDIFSKETEYGILGFDVYYSIWRKVFRDCTNDPYRRICIHCGKIKQNYNLDKILVKVDEAVNRQFLLLQRQYEAKGN